MEFNIFDHVYDSVFVYDTTGIIVYCNEAFSALSGISPNRMIGKMDIGKAFVGMEGSPVDPQEFVQYKEATNTRVVRYRTRAVQDGLGQFSVMPIQKNNEKLFVFVMRDLSVEDELHKKYRREMSLKDKKIEEMNSLIQLLQKTRLVKEPVKILEEFLRHILSLYGLTAGFIKDTDQRVHKISEGLSHELSPLMQALAQTIENLPSLKKDTYFEKDILDEWKVFRSYHIEGVFGVVIKTNLKAKFEIFIPISNSEQAKNMDQESLATLSQQMAMVIDNMTLERLSIVDDLTKLYNARYFREMLDGYAAKYPVLTMVLTDIDHFKSINDTYGHPGGDAVLQRIGFLLKQIVEKENRQNVVCRVGGEEFAILLPQKTPKDSVRVVEEIANAVRAEVIPHEDKKIKLTMSFGISAWLPDKITVRDFYTRTDQALYFSKRNGRNRWTLFDDIPI